MQELIGHIASRNHSEFELCPSNPRKPLPAPAPAPARAPAQGPPSIVLRKYHWMIFANMPRQRREIWPVYVQWLWKAGELLHYMHLHSLHTLHHFTRTTHVLHAITYITCITYNYIYYIHYTLLHIITRVACCSYTVAAAQLTVAAIHHISRQLHAITYITYIT